MWSTGPKVCAVCYEYVLFSDYEKNIRVYLLLPLSDRGHVQNFSKIYQELDIIC